MARDWPRLPVFQSEDDAADVAPEGWCVHQIDAVFEKLPIGKRFDQKTCASSGRVSVVDQSADGFVGFHDEEPGVIASKESPVITFANHTCEMRVMCRSFSVIQNVFPMVGKRGVCDTLFFYYATKGRVHLEEYKGHYPDYRRLWIPVPSLPEQKAIANILGVLDDKIELNRRMNETLEGLARAIFQSWFVDFDPVRAQRDGLPLPALSPATAALFPDSFEDSELGKIPKGWKVALLEDIAAVGSGNRPNDRGKEQTADMTVPLYGGGGCMGFVPEPLFRKPILLTGRVGTLGIIFRVDGPSWPSDNTLVIEPKSDDFFDFTYFQLRSFDLVVLNRGSTQPLLTQTDLKRQSLVLPPAELLGTYQRQSAPLFGKVSANLKQSSKLAAIRDALLPKLLSGEIRVAEAERLMENGG